MTTPFPPLLHALSVPVSEAPENASQGSASSVTTRGLPLALQLPRGRLVEFMDGPQLTPLTSAVSCLRYAQQQGEPSAWVQFERGPLFPPDLADSGIDLDALIVIQVPEHMGQFGLCKAAEFLLRSGGFGMVIVDLTRCRPSHDTAWQGRLLGLAREHDSWLLLLSPPRQEGSLGPLISLCIETERTRTAPGLFQLTPHVRKDKSGLLQALAPEQRRGPWGLL